MAELGFVGDGPNSYQVWLGGTPNQTRLAAAYQDRVKLQVCCAVCTTVFVLFIIDLAALSLGLGVV